MKKLFKKVVSVGLAAAMTLSMAITGIASASAATYYYNTYSTVADIKNRDSCSAMQGMAVGSTYLYTVKIKTDNSGAVLQKTNKNTGATTNLTNSTGSVYTYLNHANDMDVTTIDGYSQLFVATMATGGNSLVRIKVNGSKATKSGGYNLIYNGASKSVSGVSVEWTDANNVYLLLKSGSTVYRATVPKGATSGNVYMSKAFTINTSSVKINGSAQNLSSYTHQGMGYHDGKIFVPLWGGGAGKSNQAVIAVYNTANASGSVTADPNLSFRITSGAYTGFEIESCDISSDGQMYFNVNRWTASSGNYDAILRFNGYTYNSSIFTPVSTPSAPTTGWQFINGNWYYYNSNGTMLTGWQFIDNNWYYLNSNGTMAKGWVFDNNSWYYMNDNGTMAKGWVVDNNNWYYMNDNGTMAKGWVLDNNTWYYMNDNGTMAKGWVVDNNSWYYMNDNGTMAKGWVLDNNTWYYMNDNGTMAKGWVHDNGDWYYMNDNGSMAKGWVNVDGDKYYMNSSGRMVKGQQTIDGVLYNFDDSGRLIAENIPPSISNVTVTEVSESGYRVTCNVSDESGISSVKFPTWTTNNGQDDLIWHEGTVSGNTATCYISRNDHNGEFGTYYTHIYAYDLYGNQTYNADTEVLLEQNLVGWHFKNENWYYYNSDSTMAKGWIFDNDSWYYLNDNGTMAKGWVLDNDTWYYMNDNGTMAKGWVLDNGDWYYMNDNGSMAKGWVLVDNVWYYMNSSGRMVTGEQTIDGTVYYFNPNGSWAGY